MWFMKTGSSKWKVSAILIKIYFKSLTRIFFFFSQKNPFLSGAYTISNDKLVRGPMCGPGLLACKSLLMVKPKYQKNKRKKN